MDTRNTVSVVWIRWLSIVIIGVMLFGISMVLTPELIRRFFGLLIYAAPHALESKFGPEALAYVTMLHGVLGAVMFGWGVLMFMVLRGPFARGRREGWHMIAIPVTLWYLPDTAFSLWTGFWQNAVLNTVFAVLFLIPLVATYRTFAQAEN